MANIDVIMTQPKSHEWRTPPEFFRELDREFRFTLDAAASIDNKLCECWYSAFMDAFKHDWNANHSSIFVNPPYGTIIGKWVAKAYEESQKGATVVMLIPARTETSYWHEYVMKASEIRFVRGRLRFSGMTKDAPFPNAVVVFRPGDHAPKVSAIGRDGKA